MRIFKILLLSVAFVIFMVWILASPEGNTFQKNVKTVTRNDLVNIMKNLQHGTIVNKIVNKERMSTKLTKFIARGRKLRQKVLQVVKDKESNKTGTAVAVSSPMKSRTIIYNRIYKSGSASFLYLLGGSSYQNNFDLVGQGLPDVRYFLPVQKMKLVQLLCQKEGSKPRGKIMYSRHIYFTDFSQYGCDVKYLNLMRDPVERFVSRFYFNREVLESHHSPLAKSKERQTNNINTCIVHNMTECSYSGELPRTQSYFRMDSQIPFFCGDSHQCLTLGHPEAPEITIKSIEKNFLAVGTLEQMDKSFAVMVCLIPEYLSGLVDLKNRLVVHRHSKHKKVVPLNRLARKVLEERLKSEYVVYDYVSERLERQYRECVKMGLVKRLDGQQH